MIELIGRGGMPPVQLNHLQALFVIAGLLGILLAVIGLMIFEGVLARVLGFLLRITGHPPPKKSPMRVAIDAMEEEINRNRPQPPKGKVR